MFLAIFSREAPPGREAGSLKAGERSCCFQRLRVQECARSSVHCMSDQRLLVAPLFLVVLSVCVRAPIMGAICAQSGALTPVVVCGT